MTARPVVSIYHREAGKKDMEQVAMPAVFTAPIVTIPFNLFTPTWPRTDVKPMVSTTRLVRSTPLSPGELVVPSHVSQESVALVPPDPVRLLSVTCAVRVACSLPSKCGESGTERSMSTKRDTPSPQPSLPPLLLPLLLPEVTTSSPFPNSPLSLTPLTLTPPRLSSLLSIKSVLPMI